jgi:hypothetical protein
VVIRSQQIAEARSQGRGKKNLWVLVLISVSLEYEEDILEVFDEVSLSLLTGSIA